MQLHRLAVAAIVLAIAGASAFALLRPAEDPWRAGLPTLIQRAEALAAGGDVAAARGVLAEIESRGDPAARDRARVAVARAMLGAGAGHDALELVQAVPWADKAPAIAAERLALELAVRWRGLYDRDGRLASAFIPPREAVDSAAGVPGEAWLARRDAWTAFAALLDGGVRMVEREGVRVTMPADPRLITLARYAHGAADAASAAGAIGDAAGWSAELALQAVRLHLAEHEPEAAAAAAAPLLERAGRGPEAGAALAELRRWQLRRHALATRLRLWPWPELDRRIEAWAAADPQGDAAVRAEVAADAELGGAARGAAQSARLRERSLATTPAVSEQIDVVGDGSESEPEPAVEAEPAMSWRLALDHDGLHLAVPTVIAAGSAASLGASGDYTGWHRISLWRIEDEERWRRLCSKPSAEDLTDPPLAVRELPGPGQAVFPGLPEGRYAALLVARASPVMVLRGFRVAASALHLEAADDELVAWVVRRADGRGEAGAGLAVRIDLERDPVAAAGPAWADASGAWRDGFREAFLGLEGSAWRSPALAAERAAGAAAGQAAATADPARRVEVEVAAGAGGLARIAIPPGIAGPPWSAQVRLTRAGAHEAATASWGTSALWASRLLCWADKPLVRPGETLRFAGLVRDSDGERFRMPSGSLPAELSVAGETVWRGQLAIDARGMVAGEVAVPAGAAEGPVLLAVGDGKAQRIAVCDRVALQPLRLEIADDASPEQFAGEPRLLRLRLFDGAGAPIGGAKLEIAVRAQAGGESLPVEQPAALATDLAGNAELRIETVRGREAAWVVEVEVERDGRRWSRRHAFATSVFPFPLAVELEDAQPAVGDVLRARLRLPQGAVVRLQPVTGGAPVGAPVEAVGGADGQAEALLALTPAHAGADRLRVSAALPGGGQAERLLDLSVSPRPAADAAVTCLPARSSVRPGESLDIDLGLQTPRRDVLLIAGTSSVQSVAVEAVEDHLLTVQRTVAPGWGPQTSLRALAWLDGSGFVASRVSPLRVLPVDRLLRVEIAVEEGALRPGALVEAALRVSDWQGRPVAGAGIAVGAVDIRLYDLAEDATPDLWRFFHEHARPWRLASGHAVDETTPAGLFWRSVVRRWQPDGAWMAIGRSGGGYSKYGCRGAGGRAARAQALRSLGSEADPTIAWAPALVTDGDGRARLSIRLPDAPGSWRLTARAADASARVLVGEARQVVTAARRLALHADAPRLVRAGDIIEVALELASNGAEGAVAVEMGGIAQNITLGAGERRMIRLPASVPEPSADAAVLRLGDQLGRLMTLPITARLDDGETVRASVDLLVAPTGLPQRAALRLVADRDGAVHLREAPPAGALVEISVRAWPDAAARRADELSAWRQRRDARGLMAWLAAPPGAERRSALAARWPLAGDDAASQVARLAARRAGLGGGPTVLPEGVIGGWIAARARAAGLALPPPAIRGLVGRSEGERAAAAAAGLLEGWAEAPAAWAALAARWSDGLPEDPLALACGIEAARLAGDQSAAERLIAALATADWSDDLVAVLAAELLPEAGAAQAAPVTLAAGGIEVRIEAAAGARWAGLVPVAPLLRAAPGTLLAIDLRWQAPAPAQGDGTAEPLEIWQAGAEGFELLAPGAALWPDRPVVLRARPGAGRHVTLALPALLRPAPAGEVSLVLGSEELWPLPEAAAALLDGATPAPLAAQRIAPLLAAQPKLVRPIGERVQTVAAAEAGDGGLLELRDGEAIAVATTGLGRAAWPELRITDADGFRTVVLPDLRVAPGDARAAEGERGHPLRERIVAAIASAEPDELGLIAGAGPTVADWEAVLRTLDPGAAHQLADLLAHPRCGQPGHWTRDALRRWIDGSPGLASARSEGRETGLLFAEVDLAELISRAAADRSDRDAAQAALRGGPAAPALLPEPPVRAWFEALRAGGRIDEEAWEPWLWRQPLAAADIAALGYPPSIDGWVLFCRRELGLDFAIGRGVPADLACPEGEELGLIGLRAVGLEVVRRPDAGLELRAARADQRALGIELAIDCTDLRPLDALAALNQALALRGLPTVALAPGLDASALPAVTCQAHGGWTTVADALAAALELERRGSVLGRR